MEAHRHARRRVVLLLATSVAFASSIPAQRIPATRAVADTAPSSGTDDPAQRRITLAVRDLPVRDAIELIVSRSGINLVYATEAIAATGTVSCRSDSERVELLLRCVVREAGLDYYRLSSGTFVIIARAEEAPRYGTISGLVRDASSGEPIPMARLALVETDVVRTAGTSGAFAFSQLRPGKYRLLASAIGYRAGRLDLELSESGAVRTTMQLERQTITVTPVVVNGLAPDAMSRSLSRRSIDVADLPSAVVGPSLLVTAAPAVMGVAPASGSGDLHIQGGGAGEHQVRLDGVPVFDPISIDRVYGAFSPLAIGRLTVQRAGFGASAGSFTAGVIDLEHALEDTPRATAVTAQVDPGAAAARVSARGTVGGQQATGMLSARTSVWQWYQPRPVTDALRSWNMMSPVLTERLASAGLLGRSAASASSSLSALPIARNGTDLAFTDLHGAFRVATGAYSYISASGYLGNNHLHSDVTVAPVSSQQIDSTRAVDANEAYQWMTAAAQIRYETLIGARSTGMVRMRISDHALRYGFRVTPPDSTPSSALPEDRNALRDIAIDATLGTTFGPALTLQWGAELVHTQSEMRMATGILRDLRTDLSVARASTSLDVNWRLRQRLWLDLGVRSTWLPTGGRSETEPRIALRGEGIWPVAGTVAWRVGGGGYRQYITQFDIAAAAPNALIPSMRFWLPVDGSTPTPRANHVAAELVARFTPGWELRSEAYYKDLASIAAFDYGVLLDRGTSLPHQLDPSVFVKSARGEAYGAGVRLVHERARVRPLADVQAETPAVLRAELAYDFGITRRTFPSRFGGAMQPAPWNEPHRLFAAIDWSPAPAWRANVRSRAVAGRSWALRQAYYDLLSLGALGDGLPVQTPGDAARPLIVTADVGLVRTLVVGTTRIELGAAVMNAFDRRNVLDYGLERDTQAVGNYSSTPRFLLRRQWSASVRVVAR